MLAEINPRKLNLLLVDDDDAEKELIRPVIESMNSYQTYIYFAQNLNDVTEITSDYKIDVALVDNFLGPENGSEIIHELGGRRAKFPSIMLTGMYGEQIQYSALNAGAIAFLNKHNLTSEALEATIRSTLFTHQYEKKCAD